MSAFRATMFLLAAGVAAVIASADAAAPADDMFAARAAVDCSWTLVKRTSVEWRGVAANRQGVFVVGGGRSIVLLPAAKAWRRLAFPGVNQEAEIAAVGNDRLGRSVWAVGESAVVFRWRPNQSRWQRESVPSARLNVDDFAAVSVRAANDVWVAGTRGEYRDKWLVGHWNGRTWRLKAGNPNIEELHGVSASPDGGEWAVGSGGLGYQATYPVLLAHDSVWRDRSELVLGGISSLEDVLALAKNNVWAVGWQSDELENELPPLILHRNGAGWLLSEPPVAAGTLRSLAANGPKNVWAAGYRGQGDETLLIHWNGTRWQRATPPPTGRGTRRGAIEDIAIGPDGAVWAVGDGFVAKGAC